MQDFGFDLRREAQLATLTEDVVRSSSRRAKKLDSDRSDPLALGGYRMCLAAGRPADVEVSSR